MRADKEVCLIAVGRHGEALEYCSVEMRADADVVAKACTQSPGAVVFANAQALGFHPLTAQFFGHGWFAGREGWGGALLSSSQQLMEVDNGEAKERNKEKGASAARAKTELKGK
mmetsp:Transcript_3622/g.7710  ORF Transcript_3622/g.7710 Transcript_3622/m.7710 type:complete len:114 (-) Transcript_3622:185-526(-)